MAMSPMSQMSSGTPRSPHSPMSWKDGSGSNLRSAKATRDAAEERIMNSVRSHQQTRQLNAANYQNLQSNTSDKVATTRELQEMLARRMQSVDAHTQASKRCLAALRQADQAKVSPLQLNLWRQEMRAQRPHRELVRDPFELALEDEQRALQTSQDTLRQAAKDTEEMICSLGSMYQSLKFDHEHKIESKEVDETCLSAMNTPWPTSPTGGRSSLRTAGALLSGRGAPTSPTSGKKLELASGGMLTLRSPADPHANVEHNMGSEASRRRETAELSYRANKLEHEAQALREHCEFLIKDTEANCARALNLVEKTQTERINESQNMCRDLEESINDTQALIGRAAHSAAMTRDEMHSHEHPASLVDSQDALRTTKRNHELIGDPVSSASDRHRHGLQGNYQALQACNDSERDVLRQLQEEKRTLEADLADKSVALRLDLACRAKEGLPDYPVVPRVPQYGM